MAEESRLGLQDLALARQPHQLPLPLNQADRPRHPAAARDLAVVQSLGQILAVSDPAAQVAPAVQVAARVAARAVARVAALMAAIAVARLATLYMRGSIGPADGMTALTLAIRIRRNLNRTKEMTQWRHTGAGYGAMTKHLVDGLNQTQALGFQKSALCQLQGYDGISKHQAKRPRIYARRVFKHNIQRI